MAPCSNLPRTSTGRWLIHGTTFFALVTTISLGSAAPQPESQVQGETSQEKDLVGYWKLQGDCRDYSGLDNHGVNHGVRLDRSEFDGRSAYVEVPMSASLKLGNSDFSVCAWVWTEQQQDDAAGDVFEMYDPAERRGITLSLNASAGGYQSQGSDRHVYFGIDNGRLGEWEDCGRPNPTSNYVSNSLTVFDGHLYAATIDAQDEQDWCHVYRYDGEQRWIDCGRVGHGRTPGVMPLIVHNGHLYAATTTYDWTRVKTGDYDAGRVYRYLGGTHWQDCGQPSNNRTLNSLASYQGKLYVGGGPQEWGVYVQAGENQWKASMLFPMQGAQRCFPHAMSCFHGQLYVAWPGVYSFDGTQWTFAGTPAEAADVLQTHSLEIYQGHLCAGTWPRGKVARFLGGDRWEELGRVGADGTEVNALVVYNGKLYGGSIPRAEVCRFDGAAEWTSLQRFYSPDGWQPVPPGPVGGQPTRAEVNEWTRVTSLTVFAGKLFASIGSCTSAVLDAPADVRGRVYCVEAGKCVSSDRDLGPGWKHLAAIRERGTLKLYIDGQLVSTSSAFNSDDYDLSTQQPLRIGFGQRDYFCGRIAGVRLYRRTIGSQELRALMALADHPPEAAARK